MGKYYYNKDFFEKIDTEEKAYWLGFLYADGCINRIYHNEKLKAMDLEIGLCREDENHLRKFLNHLESNVDIKYKTSRFSDNTYESCRINICCTKMCYDLINKGCTPQKSLTLEFPDNNIIPKVLIKHFIRGYFDGDGCVSTGKNNIIVTNFVGTSDMLKGISDFLLSEDVIRTNPSIYEKGNAHEMFIYGADNIKDMYLYLYKNSSVYLDRKHKKFVDYFNDYDMNRKSKSGKQGVYLDKRINKWVATIYNNGKRIHIGNFECVEDAIIARKRAEINKLNAD
jgi:hypothetical protein